MRIESTTFGSITIDGKAYEHDVVVRHAIVPQPPNNRIEIGVRAGLGGLTTATTASLLES